MSAFSEKLSSESGLSSALSKAIGCSRSYVSNMKSGRKKIPEAKFDVVASVTGLSIKSLLAHNAERRERMQSA